MFTGIIEEIGRVLSVRHGANSEVLEISADKVLEGTSVGDSIAVNGVCLTVTALGTSSFSADVMPQTLRRSALQSLRPGLQVNLERAMAAGGRFGGHVVSGHTDACGRVVSLVPEDNAVVARISVPEDVMRYIAEKGSVTLNGASLTVSRLYGDGFSVSLIPHTRQSTTLGGLKAGDPVNVEVDMLARYVERLMDAKAGSVTEPGNARRGGITEDFLRENGF
ncbi:MAG: riboflavin synthase [Bacteroidetes bacterium]|uniref:Riboflavin synthase n=1 Tax=Candidatus Merdivivens pullicola TaxID=2840872 RepID=A0A9D9IGD8_9BACT|nr:riboflavin synthase [Candidatus Merdivivens pullicola]